MKSLFYLSAGSGEWGTGHLRRSLELIRVLRARGIKINAAALVPGDKDMQRLSKLVSQYDKQVHSLSKIRFVNEDNGIVDVNTDLQSDLFLWLQEQKKSAIALDWYFQKGNVIKAAANLRGGTSALRYAVIREEFRDAYKNRLRCGPQYDVAVVLGGGNNHGHLERILRIFDNDKRFSDKKIALVAGIMAEGSFKKLADSLDGRISVYRNPKNVADIMAGARIGITNGGTSLMEFTMLGVPALLYPQSPQEENFIKLFLDYGCALQGSLEPDRCAEQIFKLLGNKTITEDMSRKARELIDGRGADRIADIISKTFFYR